MNQTNQKNHRFYDIIAPFFSEQVREFANIQSRAYVTRCELTKDKSTLLVFVGFSTYSKEDFLQVKVLSGAIKRYLAGLKILGRVPEVRIKHDTGESTERTVEEIIREIELATHAENGTK